jgi:predicted glycoside hydrolase/deacetylase ChbG (UPF0249 family)
MAIQNKTRALLCRRIVVCGDDFGMNADIDYGMLELAHRRRLSAISCLVEGPTFAQHASALTSTPAELGLHLNFTQNLGGGAGPYWPLGRLILRSYARQIDPAWVDRTLQTQFEVFEQTLGRVPDYIDGHQHVHQLPLLRERLLVFMEQRYGANLPWLRCTLPGGQRGIPLLLQAKAHLIGALGGQALVNAARRYGIRMNRRLLGVYDFRGNRDRYAGLLQSWLDNAQDGDLLMCHPALRETGDALSAQLSLRCFPASRSTVGCVATLSKWCLLRNWQTSRQPERYKVCRSTRKLYLSIR